MKLWIRLAGTIAACLCLLILGSLSVSAADGAAIRVAYPIQQGLTEIAPDGSYTGYTYEYLQEIGQYLGWEYEFLVLEGDINDTLSEALELVQSGEADIVGGMNHNEALAKMFCYPEYAYGTAHLVLAVKAENISLNAQTYRSHDGLRVGLLSYAERDNGEYDEFVRITGLQAEAVYFDEAQQRQQALERGEIDVYLETDVGLPAGMRAIAQVSARPFYFAVTPGRPELAQQLGSAIRRISEAQPDFSDDLFGRSFESRESGSHIFLSDTEKAFIASADVLTVAMATYQEPLQKIDAETGAVGGTAAEVFEEIAASTGLRFEFLPVCSQDELRGYMKSGRVDLAAGVTFRYDLTGEYNMSLTQPYLSSPVVLFLNNAVTSNDLGQKTIALPTGYDFLNIYGSPVLWCESTQDSLNAVNEGLADYGFGNGYTVQYGMNGRPFRNLSLIPQTNLSHSVSIGVARPFDPDLISILNKAIGGISAARMEAIIYHDTVRGLDEITFGSFIEANPRRAATLALTTSCVLVAVMGVFLAVKLRAGRRMALANSRYEQLSELSNEYLYEYDAQRDRLVLTNKSAEFFQYPRTTEHFAQRLSGDGAALSTPDFSRQLIRPEQGPAELLARLPSGEERWLRVTAKVVRDKDGRRVSVIGKITDIQQERSALEQLEERASLDGLTGVYNAAACRQLSDAAVRAIEQGKPGGALLILDIDYFKNVNDRFGHFAGDQVLVQTAQALRSVFRHEDIIGRLGGDEFLVFLSGSLDREVIGEKCSLLLARAQEITAGEGAEPITLSIGAAFATGGVPFEDLYRAADRALYLVKNRGRNGFEIAQ